MINRRPAAERGYMKNDWLEAHYTFSFSGYHDPSWMGFGPLRVINEDYIAPGVGFPTHGHRDMEIITVVMEGAMAHKDSLGNGATVVPGDIQKMSAGMGVRHSEFNPSENERTHALQIWIEPDTLGIPASYEQRRFEGTANAFQLIASPEGRDGSIHIQQDAALYKATLDASADYALGSNRSAWVQVMEGEVAVNGVTLAAGDGAGIRDEKDLSFVAAKPSSLLLFDMRGD